MQLLQLAIAHLKVLAAESAAAVSHIEGEGDDWGGEGAAVGGRDRHTYLPAKVLDATSRGLDR